MNEDLATLPDETELVKRAIAGEADAFASLYDSHVDGVYRFIYARVSEQATAEDLTSQVFLKAWENLDGYKVGSAPFGAWLFRIARNAVIDHYRTAKNAAPLDALAGTLQTQESKVDETIEVRLEAERVVEAMKRLTEEQQQVLAMKFIEGYSTKEIAQAMGKRQGAIRALQMRGLQALEELLELEDG